jgi:hypothetical protein
MRDPLFKFIEEILVDDGSPSTGNADVEHFALIVHVFVVR